MTMDENIKSLVRNNNRFALDLYTRMRASEDSLFYSPYSITSALAMTYAGARGPTGSQMASVLGFGPDDEATHSGFESLSETMNKVAEEGQVKLTVANSLFPQDGYRIRRAYLNLVKKKYQSKVTRVDYGEVEAAREQINNWVQDATGGRIRDMISPGVLDALTRLVLVNAIYFKGDWQNQFDEAQTDQQAFFTAVETEVAAQMMHQKASFRYAEVDDLQILELPYRGRQVSMLVLLPRAVDGIGQLEDNLSAENLENWTTNLEKVEVNLSLPKFELTFPFRLDEALQEMGMVDAFTGSADFSGIEESRELYLNAVLHKAFIEVNEKGTEAAAATAVIMQTKSISFMSVDFTADHPFIFLIRENSTGSILFMGRMSNPANAG